jgi:ABC-type lipoprotein export system ATPase subunit
MNNLKSVDLSKSYTTNEESIDVLHNINLTINLHDQIAISGNSGSGKSTLLHLLEKFVLMMLIFHLLLKMN